MFVAAFVEGFHAKLDKIASFDMKGELKSHLPLCQAKLDGHKRNTIIDSASGDYSLQTLKKSLRNAYRSEDIPPSSPATTGTRHMRGKRMDAHQHRQGPTSPTFRGPIIHNQNHPLYYVFMSDLKRGVSVTVFDSEACASIVGKKTFETTMRTLGVSHLEDAKVSQNEDRFGTSTTAYKTIAAVKVPFIFANLDDSDHVEFNIRLDVIEGDLSFLISLPSLQAMRASLIFR